MTSFAACKGNEGPKGNQDMAMVVSDGGSHDGGGTDGAGSAILTISPTSNPFGDQVVGSQSADVTFTITNSGTVASGVPTLTFSGDTGEFVATPGAGCTGAIAPAGTCVFTVAFKPTSVGLKSVTATGTATPGNTVTATATGTGVADAALTMDPLMQGFGSVAVGKSSSDAIFKITNEGGVDSGALASTVTGTDEFHIITDGCMAVVLKPNASCLVTMRFSPTSVGADKAASLAVAPVMGAGGTATSMLMGTGIAPAKLEITPTPFVYTDTVVFQNSTPQQFTVTNTGGEETGTLSIPSLTFTGLTQFSKGAETCTGVKLMPLDSCTVDVTFVPTSTGTKMALLNVSESGGSTGSAALSGKGIAQALLTIEPAAVPFGKFATGTSSIAVELVVRNNGEVATSDVLVELNGANKGEFAITEDNCTPLSSLPVDGTCTIFVQFNPTSLGLKGASIDVSAATGGSDSTSLTGEGTTAAQLQITSPSLPANFGSKEIGTTTSVDFVVTNTGGVATTDVSASIGGGDSDQFVIAVNGCSGPLAAGDNCTVTVNFVPTASDTFSSTLTVSAATGGSPTATLNGTGLTHALFAIGPSPFPYGTFVEGTKSSAVDFSVTNNGQVQSSLPVITKVGAAGAQFEIFSNGCTAPLDPGDTCHVFVKFAPLAATAPASFSMDLTVSQTGSGSTGGTTFATLTGTSAKAAALSITSPSLPFGYGTVILGSQVDQVFTLKNNGGVPTTAILTELNKAGGSAAFTIVNDTCNGNTLTASGTGGDSCTVTIRYKPTANGAVNGTLDFSATTGGAASASFSGTGSPALTITPTGKVFADTVTNGTSAAQTFIVKNVGSVATGNLTATKTGDGTQFTIQNDLCTGQNLAPTIECTFDVVFAPTSPTPAAKAATITWNGASNGTVAANVSGQAVRSLSVSPNPLHFDLTATGTTTNSLTMTFANNSPVQTPALTTTVTGAQAGQFLITNNCQGQQLTALTGTCTVVVRYQPTVLGPVSITFTAQVAAGDATTATIEGSGGNPAKLEISPPSHDFQALAPTPTAAFEFTVTNTGDLPTGSQFASLLGTDASEFEITADSCLGNLLLPGNNCKISVRYVPGVVGTKVATLRDQATPGGAPTAALTATSLRPAALQFEPGMGSGHAYGSIENGTSSAPFGFVLRNTGEVNTGAVVPSIIEGEGGTSFSISSTTCPTTAAGLAPNATCTVNVIFSPGTNGSKTATLQVTATPGSTITSSLLTGTGLNNAKLVIDTPNFNFGNEVIGFSSEPKTFIVTNTGEVNSPAVNLAITGPNAADFISSDNGCLNEVLSPSESCSFVVTFKPNVRGAETATATVSGGTLSVSSTPLQGNGQQRSTLTITPTTFGFADTLIGQTSAGRSFDVQNTGDVNSGTLTIALNGKFINLGTGTCGNSITSLTPSQICTVIVAFSPDAAGDRGSNTGAVKVSESSFGEAATATLSGRALKLATLVVDLTSFDFGFAVLGGAPTNSAVFTYTNQGDTTTGILAATQLNAADFKITDDLCLGKTLAPNATCTIEVEFQPGPAPVSDLGAGSNNRVDLLTLAVFSGAPATPATSNLKGLAGTASAIRVSPSPHTFTAKLMNTGNSSPVTFTVTNDGAQTSALSTGFVTSTTEFSVGVDNCVGQQLAAAGGTCTFTIVFHPTGTPAERGVRGADFQISATTGGTTTATVNGVGQAPATIELTPVSWNFGSVPLGDTSDPKVFKVSNTGDVPTGSLIGSSSLSGPFTVTSSTCAGLGSGLPGNTECDLQIVFQPTVRGGESPVVPTTSANNGTLTISDGSLSAQSSLKGVGLALPSLRMTPKGLSFGSSPIGVPTTEQTFDVTNDGDISTDFLSTLRQGFSPADFQITNDTCNGTKLAGLATCSVTLRFLPQNCQGNSRDAEIRVSDIVGAQVTGSVDGTTVDNCDN